MPDIFTILLVEDDGSVASTVKDNIEEQCENVRVEIEPSLGNAVESLKRIKPDAVVLDLIEGPLTGGDMAGNLGWREIWNHRFVPLVVYTASANETEPPLPEGHPFVVRIAKGDASSVNQVVSKMNEYLPYMKSVRNITDTMTQDVHRVLT